MLISAFALSNFKQGSDIYVGAQIENLMPYPLIVERLAWEPGPLIKVTDLNSLVDWTRCVNVSSLMSSAHNFRVKIQRPGST